MARGAIGIDIGTDAVRLVAGVDRKGAFQVRQLVVVPLPRERREDLDHVGLLLREALAAANVKGAVDCGLTGRDVVIRYSQVPPVPDWQLRQLMEFEIKEMTGQSGEELAADFNLVPVASDVSSDDTVLLALAKRGVLDAHAAVLGAAGLKARSFRPNAIALYNAYRKAGNAEGTALLMNIGARNTDMAVVQNGDLVFARNLSGGGDLFDEALIASFNVSAHKARRLKEELADVSPFDQATRRSPQEEKVARALSGATGQIFSMVQSSVTFARSQTGVRELALDRVLLCGGGALLKGLDRYLSSNLGVPVERFDPFGQVDTSGVDPQLDEKSRTTAVVALGLAVSALYPDLYSIEILPPALKKARTFKEKTAFAIAAGVLAVLFVAHDAYRSATDEAAAARDETRFRRELETRQGRRRDYEKAVAERAEYARRVELLEERVVGGTGLERTLALLQRYLPEDFYVTSIAHKRTTDLDLGIVGEAKPVVEVRGEGREGAEALEQLFNRFAQDLDRDALLPRTPKTAIFPGGANKPFQWTITMNFSEAPAGGEEAGEDEAGGEERK
ncbi:MAG: pilus assembly protein PilM [Planctomycetes bacterium]|nr:pilus assembly protein PilM [Planctomycetota bacterium]